MRRPSVSPGAQHVGHHRAAAQAQGARHLRRRRQVGGAQQHAARGAVLARQVLAEAGLARDLVVDHRFLHEGAAALVGAQQAAILQPRDRLAHGVAVDQEALGELRLGRQARAGA